jgi:hypothetical protein
MEEDVAGTLRVIGHDTALCSLCGRPYPPAALTPLEIPPETGILSAWADICPHCRDALARGEDPASLSGEDPVRLGTPPTPADQ